MPYSSYLSEVTNVEPSQRITEYIANLNDWRGALLDRIRQLIRGADPELVEEWKWRSPVWSKGGLVCSASAFKRHVSVSFFEGASLADPAGLFNSPSEAKAMRSIRLEQGDDFNDSDFQALVRAAVAHNVEKS